MNQREHEILNQTVQILVNHLEIDKVILFGSRAREKSSLHADFDLAINSEKPEVRKRRQIMDEIEKVCGLYKVDLVFLDSVDKRFKNIILETGKVIYERDERKC
ncbi:MAG: nucleotidyltransferase domain-containing protein [bacterium]|nr:nucleotidyltransferase domain-containing protein [bacterium]